MNLQLDHFPMIKPTTHFYQTEAVSVCFLPALTCFTKTKNTKPNPPLDGAFREERINTLPSPHVFEHGFHNVSRWMTWLPISLKNAAKCDKWYQLQNLSITESLNANGAREKPPTAIPVHAVSLSVEQKPNLQKESWFVEGRGFPPVGDRVVTPSQPSNRRFMGNECFKYSRPVFPRALFRGRSRRDSAINK